MDAIAADYHPHLCHVRTIEASGRLDQGTQVLRLAVSDFMYNNHDEGQCVSTYGPFVQE
jgi:hypothetical protein